MKLIILSAEAENFVPQELKKKAEEKGYDVEIINPDECYISISSEPYISYNGTKFLGADVCIPRMSEENSEYKVAIMDHLVNMGVKCVNSGSGMQLASNKLECQIVMNKNGIKTPNSVMLTDASQLDYAVKSLGEKFPVIVKTIYGTHGIGVMRIDSMESLRSVVQHLLKTGDQFILQEFIPHNESYRILMLNDKVIAGVSRSVPEGDFRTNAHQGSELKAYSPTEQEIELAKKCAKLIDLNFMAIDYVKNGEELIILEINGSPGYEALQKVVDFDISEKVIELCMTMSDTSQSEKEKEKEKEEENKDVDVEVEKENGKIEVEVETNDKKIEVEVEPKEELSPKEEVKPEPEEEEEEVDLTDDEVIHNTDQIIGTVTHVTIKNFNDDEPIDARVDTGATHSSINGQNVEVSDNIVKFTFGKYRYKFYLARMSNIKTSDNGTEERPVIKVDIIINGNEIKNVEFNVNEREHMKYDIILGRSTLEAAGVLVNPAITKITDKEENKTEEE